jgi:glycosyltransferase involved in cell wall biosynthesis
MKVSIAMATYNGEEYIKEQLESFINQTIQPDELIISDDKSTDNTLKIIHEFAENVSFEIKVTVNDYNLGYTGNFNSALLKSTGDVVFLCDQDDVWFPEKIKHMLNVMNNNPDNLVYMNDTLLTDDKLNSKNLTKYGQIKSADLGDDKFVMGCCCMIRQELLTYCLPVPSELKGHDDWIVGIAEGLSQKYIDETVLQYYRRHESNESNFIANKTKKINKKDIWFSELKKMILKKEIRLNKANEYLKQEKIFFKGLLNIKKLIPKKFDEEFKKFLDKRIEKLKVLELRYRLRESNIIKRSISAPYFYFFVYDKKTRFRNMLRDIIS